MSRSERERLNDVATACAAISLHLEREGIDDTLRFDAIRIRLIEIGEAVKDLGSELRETEPTVPWAEISGMRDHLTHRYFDTEHSMVRATAQFDVPVLAAAVTRMLSRHHG